MKARNIDYFRVKSVTLGLFAERETLFCSELA